MRRSTKASIPYARAVSGDRARKDITEMLRKFGCESVGLMDDFAEHAVVLAFTHHGRSVQMRASAKGWAAMYLKANPWKRSTRQSEVAYRDAALAQGHRAVNSMLRDWVKGQLTAVECGLVSFDAVFLPHMITHDGRPLLDQIYDCKLLPPPHEELQR